MISCSRSLLQEVESRYCVIIMEILTGFQIVRPDGEAREALLIRDIVSHVVRGAQLLSNDLLFVLLVEKACPNFTQGDAPDYQVGAERNVPT